MWKCLLFELCMQHDMTFLGGNFTSHFLQIYLTSIFYWNRIVVALLFFILVFSSLQKSPAVVVWIVRALFWHSVEEYGLAIGGLNPAWDLCI